MAKRASLILIALALLPLTAGTLPSTGIAAQSEPTLAGEWIVVSSPINNQLFSRKGNTLGFPDRHMRFEQDAGLYTGMVLREDVGPNVNPLGVWRIWDDKLSATFHLWCPVAGQPCGSVVMRGEFVNESRIRGTMTVFFDVVDETTPTGLDTWTFAFRGDRIAIDAD